MCLILLNYKASFNDRDSDYSCYSNINSFTNTEMLLNQILCLLCLFIVVYYFLNKTTKNNTYIFIPLLWRNTAQLF